VKKLEQDYSIRISRSTLTRYYSSFGIRYRLTDKHVLYKFQFRDQIKQEQLEFVYEFENY